MCPFTKTKQAHDQRDSGLTERFFLSKLFFCLHLRSPLSPFPLSFWEMLPQTSTTGEAHESEQGSVSPLRSLNLTPIAWTAGGMVPQLPPPAAGSCPGTAMSSTVGIPSSPCPPETTTSSPPWGHSTSKAHTSPLQAQLPLQICFPLAFLLYHNNLLAFCWTATYCPGSFMQAGEKDSLYLSISDPYFSVFKNSPRECCLYCCCIFLSCPFILNKLLPPPQATCSHLWPALPSVFNYHFTYLLWLYAESLTLENTLHVALLSLRCWLDWLLSWPWGQDSTQRP